MNCTCGHGSEDHVNNRFGPVECGVEGCDCFQYDWDGEDEDNG